MKVEVFTNGIPQCPYCNKPTKRTSAGGSRTLMYSPPSYDENGINTNPDRNIITKHYGCVECGKFYTVKGNNIDGFEYGGL